jgi:hypothetical protein
MFGMYVNLRFGGTNRFHLHVRKLAERTCQLSDSLFFLATIQLRELKANVGRTQVSDEY